MKNNKLKKYILGLIVLTLIGVIIYVAYNSPFVSSYTLEAGSQIKAEDLLKKEGTAEFISQVDESLTKSVGTHSIEVKYDDKVYKVKLKVVDTIAPEIVLKPATFYVGDDLDVYQCVEYVFDYTQVTLTLDSEVDMSSAKECTITIKAQDEGHNIVSKQTQIHIIEDKEAPVISISKDIYVTKGESVSYRQYINVNDNRDGMINDYIIDSSKINLTKEGTYTLTVSAIDQAGNKSVLKENVYVVSYDIEKIKNELKTYASQILNQIIHSSMNKEEKLEAVYNYVTNSYSYQGYHSGDIDNYYYDAYYGFKNRRGDCYVVNAMARYLLESLDIKTYGYIVKGKKDTHIFYVVENNRKYDYYSALKRSNGTRIYKWSDKQVLDYLKKWDGVTKLPELND